MLILNDIIVKILAFYKLIVQQQNYRPKTCMNIPQSNSNKNRKYSAFESEKTAHTASNRDNELNFEIRNLRKGSAEISPLLNKYKTQVCNYWQTGRTCPFGNSCNFAHGGVEVRSKDGVSQKYKTKLCKNFNQNAYCPYGQRCQFIHSDNKKQRLKPILFYEWFSGQAQILSILSRQRRKLQICITQQPQLNKISQRKIIQNPEPSQVDDVQFAQQFLNQHKSQAFQQYYKNGYIKPRLYSL